MTKILTSNELKLNYEKFQQDLPKDEFSKTYKELQLVRAIISAMKKEEISDDIFKYQKIEKENITKLHNMGYKNIK